MSGHCTGHGRHWYTFYGQPGLRSPACVRCGHPNPRPLREPEWSMLLSYRKMRGYPFADPIETAISDEISRRRTVVQKVKDTLAEIEGLRL